MSCLSDRKPSLPFVINLFCASYNLASLSNGITLKVTDTQHEANIPGSSASCPASLLLPPLFATRLGFIDSFLPFPQPISDAFWMLPAQRVLLCDSADQCPALCRGKCFSEKFQTQLHQFSTHLPVHSYSVQEFRCAALPLLNYMFVKLAEPGRHGLGSGHGIQEPFTFRPLGSMDAQWLAHQWHR